MRPWRRKLFLALGATVALTVAAVVVEPVVVEQGRATFTTPEVLDATLERSTTTTRLDAAPVVPVAFIGAAPLPVPSPKVPVSSPKVSVPSPTAGPDLVTRAEALVHYDWRSRLAGWRIEFLGPRDGYRGSTFPDLRLVQVYVRPGDTADDVAHVFAHELGHAVDVTRLSAADRERFSEARGRAPDAGWWVTGGSSDFGSGAGDWAESFSWWARRGVGGGWSSTIGPPPDAGQQALIARLAGV